MTGNPAEFVAMVPLKAFLPVAMPFAFSDKDQGIRNIR